MRTMVFKRIFVLFLVLFIQFSYSEEDQFRVVQIDSGKVRGRKELTFLDQRPFYAFRGIPYARPPLGLLRFRPPVKPDSWENVRDALDYGSECLQQSYLNDTIIGNEDCLTINVFTPNVEPSTSLPVVFYIHGGAYYSGASKWFGPEFLLNEDIVVVTFNYRLGPFGFLTLSVPEYSGNTGLKDQVLALKWVNENIYRFGGDNRKITIYGQSNGAAATNLHLVVPASQGLFQRAILSSGSALIPSAFSPFLNHNPMLDDLAEELGTVVSSEDQLIEFLQNVDAKLLLKNTHQPLYIPGLAIKAIDLIWAPVIEDAHADNAFMTKKPEHYLYEQNERFNVDTLFGFNDYESYLLISQEIPNPDTIDPFNREFKIQLPLRATKYNYSSEIYREYSNEIRKHYFGDKNVTEDLLAYTELLSDVFFVYGIDKAVKAQLKLSTGKTYYYKFSVNLDFNIFRKLSNASIINLPGNTHCDELPYIFKFNEFVPTGFYDNILSDSKEGQTIRRMVKIIADFSRNGNPASSQSVDWKPVEKNKTNYVSITNDAIIPGVDPNAKNIKFWDEFFLKHRKELKIKENDLSLEEILVATEQV